MVEVDVSWWVRVVVALAQVLCLIKLYRGTVSCRPLYYHYYFHRCNWNFSIFLDHIIAISLNIGSFEVHIVHVLYMSPFDGEFLMVFS